MSNISDLVDWLAKESVQAFTQGRKELAHKLIDAASELSIQERVIQLMADDISGFRKEFWIAGYGRVEPHEVINEFNDMAEGKLRALAEGATSK